MLNLFSNDLKLFFLFKTHNDYVSFYGHVHVSFVVNLLMVVGVLKHPWLKII